MTHAKRLLCVLLCGCLALLLATGAFAAEPEQTTELEAPEMFVLLYRPHDPAQNEEGGNDIVVYYTLSEQMLSQLSDRREIRVQLDIAADENSFHTDEGSYISFDEEVRYLTRLSFGDIQTDTTRGHLGGEAYFSYKTERSASGRVTVWYLNDDVTLYARMRILADDLVGEWSQTVSFGATTTAIPDYPQTFSAPVISDASLSIEDQSVSFFLNVPPEIRTYAALLAVREDGEEGAVVPHFEYSVNSSEFQEAVLADGAGIYTSEKITVSLPQDTLQDYSFAQLRMYYTVIHPDGTSEPTEASQTIFAKAQAHEVVTTTAQENTEDAADKTTDSTVASPRGTCPICGHCSQPLGLCIFIWLGAVLVIAVIAMIAILIRFLAQKKSCPRCGKGCRKNARVCEKCGFRFTAKLPLIEEEDRRRGRRKKGEEKDPLEQLTEENTLQGAGGVAIPYSSDADAPKKEQNTDSENDANGRQRSENEQ